MGSIRPAVVLGASLPLSRATNLQREGRHRSRLEDLWRERGYDAVGGRERNGSLMDSFRKVRTESS